MSSTGATIPKATLYFSPRSIWSSVALLAIEEKGYGADEIDLRVVELAKGENFSSTYLRINSKGTVPTLVVPLEKTLAPEIENRYKAITETIAVIDLLDKSRSAISRTHTTSTAPAPALAPATIALSAPSKRIIDLLHSDVGSPHAAFYMSFHDSASLQAASETLVPYFTGRRDALGVCIADDEKATVRVSEKTRKFWEEKKRIAEELLEVFQNAGMSEAELSEEDRKKRHEYFAKAQLLWDVGIKQTLVAIDKEMIGPYALGDQLSIADLHLAPYLARLIHMSGGKLTDTGDEAIAQTWTRRRRPQPKGVLCTHHRCESRVNLQHSGML